MRALDGRLVCALVMSVVASMSMAGPTGSVVELELLTTTEVAEKIAGGMRSVLIANGGTEARGPHDVLGAHTIMARAAAVDVARQLGDALVAPVLPIAVGATGVSEGTDNPGGVTMTEDAFSMVKAAEIQSMAWNGFTRIFVMGDHGGGQDVMQRVAAEMDGRLSSEGVRVFYVPDFYFKYQDDVRAYCTAHNLPIGAHRGVMETSRLLYLEPAPGVYVRAIFKTVPFNSTGPTPAVSGSAPARRANSTLDGDPHPYSKALGRDLQAIGVNDTVAQIRKLLAAAAEKQ